MLPLAGEMRCFKCNALVEPAPGAISAACPRPDCEPAYMVIAAREIIERQRVGEESYYQRYTSGDRFDGGFVYRSFLDAVLQTDGWQFIFAYESLDETCSDLRMEWGDCYGVQVLG